MGITQSHLPLLQRALSKLDESARGYSSIKILDDNNIVMSIRRMNGETKRVTCTSIYEAIKYIDTAYKCRAGTKLQF